MQQSVAHRGELADGTVQFAGPVDQLAAVDAYLAIGCEHPCDLVQREARRAPQRDERQPLQHGLVEHASLATPADGGDQPLVLVEAQRGGRHAGALRHFADVELPHC